MQNQIGDHRFLFLQGNPDPPKEMPDLMARGGVDGVGVWRTGVRGKPFALRSQVDCASMDEAREEFARYAQSIAQDAVALIQDDYDYTAEGWLVVVLDVRETARHVQIRSTGGFFSPGPSAWLEAEWTLVAVPKPEDEE